MRFGAEVKRHEVDENQPVETDGLLQIGTFNDFLLGQSAAQNGSPQGLSNVSNTTAGRRHFPPQYALHRLRGLRPGRH